MEDDRIENTRNRVFENSLAIGKNIDNSLKTISTSVYRVIGRKTGTGQIDDIMKCGYVRPKLTPVTDKHHNELFWTKGGEKTFYMNGNGMILEAPEYKVKNNQMGAIPFEDLIGIWVFSDKECKYINVIDYYRDLYEQVHMNHSL